MASSKREKELARQRAERQAARRAAAAQRRKQRQAVIASVVAVLLVAGGAVFAATQLGGGSDTADPIAASRRVVPRRARRRRHPGGDHRARPPSTAPEPTSEPSTEPTSSTAPLAPGDPGCEYPDSGQEAAKEVAKPPTVGVETEKTYVVTMTTDRGVITWEQDSAKTPCTSNNLRSLAHFQYFDDTPCHRLTTAGISVLQCGDPTGTGRGGPGYTFADEALEGATYPRGTVAMANGGPDTNGSQFFLVYEDSSLPPNYTPFGTITSGLDVLDTVAAEGSDESNGTGDGKPNLPVQIQTLRTAEKR